jgi:hypothetical protein
MAFYKIFTRRASASAFPNAAMRFKFSKRFPRKDSFIGASAAGIVLRYRCSLDLYSGKLGIQLV